MGGGEEGPPDAGGVLSVSGGEVAIPRGHGEAIGFADGGVADDFDGDVEVADHAFDDGELLVVFLAEDGEVWEDEVEEF